MVKRKYFFFIKNIITLSIAVVMTILVVISYAWFTNKNIEGSFGFETGGTKLVDMDMFTYTTEEENPLDSGWKITSIKGVSNTSTGSLDGLPSDGLELDKVDVTSSSFKIDDLHFGKIDNLVSLKNDNTIYLKFYLNTFEHGSKIRFDHKLFKENPYMIYSNDVEGNSLDVTSLYKDELDTLIENKTIFTLNVKTSDKSINDGEELQTFFSGRESSTANLQYRGEGDYFLYVKLTPNLTTFSHIAEKLIAIMPCFMVWSYLVELEVY